MSLERLKRILQKLLFPGLMVVAVCVVLAAVLLIYVFGRGLDHTPLAYAAYFFSAYALTIACSWTARYAGRTKKQLCTALHQNPLTHLYLTDHAFKIHISLYGSLAANLLYAAMKLFCGVFYRSVWFGTLGVYYSLLALMRFLLLRHVIRTGIGADLTSEWKHYRLCGGILLFLNSALSGVVVLMVRKNEGFDYAGYLIYLMAMYAFYNIITAVLDVVKYRRFQSPVMSAAKAVKLAAALVSMLSLETAMLAQFGSDEHPEAFRQSMTGITGGCVCLIVLGMAIYMIASATKRLKEREEPK